MVISALVLLLTIFGQVFVEGASSIDTLAQDVSRVESIRQIKNIQKHFSHFAQFGQWQQIIQLFSPNSTLIWGNTTAKGQSSIKAWLRNDARDMNGIAPGSLNTLIAENPVISLSAYGKTAKGRWNGIRFQGDGNGKTLIQGGVYENEYKLMHDGWRISLLHYYPMYEGAYEDGWRNVDGKEISIIPYHFSSESSGLPILPAEGESESYNGTMEQLERRIQRLNDEDDVRNLMHARGYYIDRRMWTDVVDLFTSNAVVMFPNGTKLTGKSGVRKSLELMGSEGLSHGINNDHPIFDMIVEISGNGKEALVRGIEIGMLGNANTPVAYWEFNVFRNRAVKEGSIWKVQNVELTPIMAANYYNGWGSGGMNPPNSYIPPFLNTSGLVEPIECPIVSNKVDVSDLERRLRRSAAFDGAENQSHAYGYFLDDLQAQKMGELFARKGHKASPFVGFFQTPERITQANIASYGTNRSALRSSISFHWRLQPVILVSDDGKSATLRARLLQPSTSVHKSGSFNSAIYHDQVVLEEGKWRLWSVTIDEFYWQSSSWKDGWSKAILRNTSQPGPGRPNAEPPAVGSEVSARHYHRGRWRERKYIYRWHRSSHSVARDSANVVPISQSSKRTKAGVVLARMCSMSGSRGLVTGGERMARTCGWPDIEFGRKIIVV
ncbi:hypothetical protein BKA66DRAFT_445514 [Pyrenochaeta sp. MPI-SDFR-AT-0127]|nr:hypothetical protein BKA66DRAFT_445514 [Pyrenochaeta sp. MPI-SDFR-AT-0127]